jgi:hypothetical protein
VFVELVGTEALSLEVQGTVPMSIARPLLGALTPELVGDRLLVSLLIFRMTGMRARGIPFPRFDYGEALWRIGIIHDGIPAWFALRCDLDDPIVSRLGRTAIRYPVRAARFQFVDAENECTFSIHAEEGQLSLLVLPRVARSVPSATPRRVLARGGRHFYEIPWWEDAAPQSDPAKLTWRDHSLVRATLGCDVAWSDEGVLLRGRTHHCGLARRAKVAKP